MSASDRAALTERIVGVLRESDGFPVSADEIAGQVGEHFVSRWYSEQIDRPACWPDDFTVTSTRSAFSYCVRCAAWHIPPVWRTYCDYEIRPILNQLAASGRIEKVVIEGIRKHYWRAGVAVPDEAMP